jgi:hypothetical protein
MSVHELVFILIIKYERDDIDLRDSIITLLISIKNRFLPLVSTLHVSL